MKKLCFIILLSMAFNIAGEYRYNFTYTFRGHAHGRVLLIIPYRVYYESSASVNFLAERMANGNLRFSYDGIGDTGYMMRTSGFGGKTLAILTADYDFNRSIPFGEKKMTEIEDRAPYYAKYIKRKKNFQFRILSKHPQSICFTRNRLGVHSEFNFDFPIQFRYHPENLNIDFFIYAIMIEILKGYDHASIRVKDLQSDNCKEGNYWESPDLDYSSHMNRIAPLAARVMKRLKAFRQKKPFRVQYQVVSDEADKVRVCGNSTPNIPIWGSFRIHEFSRETILSKVRQFTLEDSFVIQIQNPKGNGMKVQASLRIIE